MEYCNNVSMLRDWLEKLMNWLTSHSLSSFRSWGHNRVASLVGSAETWAMIQVAWCCLQVYALLPFLMNILILTKVRIISTKNNLQSTFPDLELIKKEEERDRDEILVKLKNLPLFIFYFLTKKNLTRNSN